MAEIDFGQFDLIFHEAGIPPIHTSQEMLSKLDPKIKDKFYLYHIAKKEINYEKYGLKRV